MSTERCERQFGVEEPRFGCLECCYCKWPVAPWTGSLQQLAGGRVVVRRGRDWLHTKALILVNAHSSDLSRQTSKNVTSRLRITHGRIVMAELAVAMLITNRPNMTVWAFAQNGKLK